MTYREAVLEGLFIAAVAGLIALLGFATVGCDTKKPVDLEAVYRGQIEQRDRVIADLDAKLAAARGKEPKTIEEVRAVIAEWKGKVAGLEALEDTLVRQERARSRERWVFWLTTVSLLGAAGLVVLAFVLKGAWWGRLLAGAAGLGCVPVIVRMFDLIESWMGWLLPVLVATLVASTLLPELRRAVLAHMAGKGRSP